MLQINLKPLHHLGKEWMGIYFKSNNSINNLLKKDIKAKWSSTHKCWYVPLLKENWQKLKLLLPPKAMVDYKELKDYLAKQKSSSVAEIKTTQLTVQTIPLIRPSSYIQKVNIPVLERMIEQMKLQGKSSSTIRTYQNEMSQLLVLLKTKHADDLTPNDLRRYLIYCYEKLHLTENTLHSRMNALKFYYEQVLKREKFFWEIPRPKKQLQLPRFFNQNEIASIIKSAGNLKHRTMLMLAYSSGLRVSEVVKMKTKDIDSKRMTILIQQAKGKKDRIVTLSPLLLVMLRAYWKQYKPSKNNYLFEGQQKGDPYSTRSLQLVLAAAKEKAGVLKPGSIHALRHSFATHLLDKGTDVTMIMKLLGHNDIKTTLRYLHVTNRDMLKVLSPLDDLNLE